MRVKKHKNYNKVKILKEDQDNKEYLVKILKS